MLYKLDESFGKIIKAMNDANMLKNTIVVFTTDNGGPAAGFDLNAASNWPLRGGKSYLWEGGIHGACFVWSPLLKRSRVEEKLLMGIHDWLPTLYEAAGISSLFFIIFSFFFFFCLKKNFCRWRYG